MKDQIGQRGSRGELALLILLATELLVAACVGFPRLPELLRAPSSQAARIWGPGLAMLSWMVAAGLVVWALRRWWGTGAPRTRGAWARITGQPGSLIGVAILTSTGLAALLAPLLAPHDPLALHAVPPLCPPSAEAWLGSDPQGRDLLSRLLWGGRVSLGLGLASMALAAAVGVSLGALAGYRGGRVDSVVVGLADLGLAMPRLVLVLAILGMMRLSGSASLVAVVVVLGLTGWMTMARMVRIRLVELRRGAWARAAHALGIPPWRVMSVHLLPHCLAPVAVYAALGVGQVILVEAALSFLGLGVPKPLPSWGATIALGQEWLRDAWWLATFPGLAIVLVVVGWVLVGEGFGGKMSRTCKSP